VIRQLPGVVPYRPRVLRRQPSTVVITSRMADCLDGLFDGLSNAQIGARHHVTEDTVKTMLRRLYRLLGARDRAHAVGLVGTSRVTVLVRDPDGARDAA
jgi:DNA-binding NarL/FixJ family response regulator